MATALMVSWNCRNRMMPAYTLRPHLTADTMLVKLLSISRMSDASFAMDVPAKRRGGNIPFEPSGGVIQGQHGLDVVACTQFMLCCP